MADGSSRRSSIARRSPSTRRISEPIVLLPEPRYIYSNRSYWYPQATVADYATARLEITVPPDYDAVASGTPAGPPSRAAGPVRQGDRARKRFVFTSDRPMRYLACVISRFNVVTTAELVLSSSDERRATSADDAAPHGPATGAAPAETSLSLTVQANPRQASRGRGTADRTAAIFKYYTSLIGDVPYPSFTVALSESDLPGGHSPAYFAILNQPLPTSPYVWRNDPVSFNGYPSFFLAHELGHQWWGQAIGWKNYHEQWLSEGFAQYFAAMYAEQERGTETFEDVLRQMRRWAIDTSPQGPVYLGYRLGHIKSDSRVFRAVIYNKAAMVLHMLRRMVGDEAFFRGIRAFYAEWRFQKAGTDDFRAAMARASGQDLTAFFDAWIFRHDDPAPSGAPHGPGKCGGGDDRAARRGRPGARQPHPRIHQRHDRARHHPRHGEDDDAQPAAGRHAPRAGRRPGADARGVRAIAHSGARDSGPGTRHFQGGGLVRTCDASRPIYIGFTGGVEPEPREGANPPEPENRNLRTREPANQHPSNPRTPEPRRTSPSTL